MPTRLLAKKSETAWSAPDGGICTQARVPGVFFKDTVVQDFEKIISGRNRIFVYGQRKIFLPV
jgi:hypothetical protein